MIWTKAFWKGAFERAVKTFFQVFGATILVNAGASVIPAVGVEGINWVGVLSLSTLAAILSLATSIGNASFTAGEPAVLAVIEPAPTKGVVLPLPDESRDAYRARTGFEFPE